MFKDKRVFVSGGAGVIGNVLVDKLYKQGAKVFVGDLKSKPAHWPKEITYRQGDLNYITLEELEHFDPQFFFHLAATFERSIETYNFWDENYQHNIKLSHHLITCLKDSKSLKKVVFASSYLIYNPELYSFTHPAEQPVRLREDAPIYPRNLTGVAKLLHEVELHFLSEANLQKCEIAIARIYRSYGKNSRDVISRWIGSLIKGESLNVYGKEGMFDYIYADEVAEGLIKIATNPVTGIVNLGRGRARRVEEVLRILKNYFPDMKIVETATEIPFEASEANMERCKALTRWTPGKDLEDVIPEIIEYQKSHSEYNQNETKITNTLVTSISQKVPLLKALKLAYSKLGLPGGIYGGDLNASCIGSFFVDNFWHMPKLEELPIEKLIQYCDYNNITRIIPTRDGELLYFAKYKDQLLSKDIRVMISNQPAVQTCLDKVLFFEKVQELGFPGVETKTEVMDLNGQNYVVKERFGAGSCSIGLNLSREQAVTHAISLMEPIFQPYYSGTEYSVDVYVDLSGKSKGVVVRERKVVVNGESQVTMTVNNKELEQLCSDLSERLELYGHVVFQVIIDKCGYYHIIECNSRFGGASTLSLRVGLDSFYWFLLESMGIDLSDYPFVRSMNQKTLIRYAEDLFLE